MIKYLIVILLVLNPLTDLDKIARINKAKKEAKQAYLEHNYQLAHDTYKFLIDSLGVNEDEVMLDFAHTQYQLKDTTEAVNNYQKLAESTNPRISSIAEQQLGQVLFDKKQYEPALEHYKKALKQNPANEDARYNYELLKKLIQKQKDQQKQNQDQQNKDQQNKDKQDQKKDQQNKDDKNKDQQNKDQKDQKDQQKQDQQQKDQEQQQKEQQQKEQEKKDGKKDEEKEQKPEQKDEKQKDGEKSEQEKKEKPTPSPSDKLKEMNISEEKAKMILEAMKNNEIQYIQQNKRKATKRKNSGKPDW